MRSARKSAAKRPAPDRSDHALDLIAAEWTRLGVWLSTAPATSSVDVESLVVRTSHVARDDERLFVGAATWLATYHGWVNGRRLAGLLSGLCETDRVASAVAGALLSLASAGTDTLGTGRATELEGATAECHPLARPRPLFAVMERFPTLRGEIRSGASTLYRRWGLWHNDTSLKPTAVRPTNWLLRHVPELRVRALVGPSLEADLITLARTGPLTARDLARAMSVSYAAAHGAADRMVARGLVRRERAGARQLLLLTAPATAAMG